MNVLLFLSTLAVFFPSGDVVPAPATAAGGQDLQAYRRIVERVHGGENYYDAAAVELREGGYASASVFNWRLPTYAWLLGVFPRPEWGQGFLCFLAIIGLGLAYTACRRESGLVRCSVLLLAMAGAFLWCMDGDAFFSQELWAGVLIAISVGAYAVAWRGWGVAAGLAALAMRELALPYVVISALLAWREHRLREVAVWCAGLAVFGCLMAWHTFQVHQHLTGTEYADPDGWIQFGGPLFVYQTCKMNAWFMHLPGWAMVLYLAAALAGLGWGRGPERLRIGATVGVYMSAFLVVGKAYNDYWGLLFVPLLAYGVAQCPSLRKVSARRLIPSTGPV